MKEINYQEVNRVIQLTGGRFLRKVRWDMLWHVCFGHPLSWNTKYNRIPSKSLGGYMSHVYSH
jgi:hypothetical protein